MIIDTRAQDAPTSIQAEFCIVGAGVMGVAIARELVAAGKSVALVESGGDEFDPDIQELCEMELTGLPPVDEPSISRLRLLGGSSNHWGGWNIPWADEVISEWPVGPDEVKPFYGKTLQYLGLRQGDQRDLNGWGVREAQYFHDYGPRFSTGVRQVRPFKVWIEYGEALSQEPGCTVLTHASLIDFSFASDLGRLEEAMFRNLAGKEIVVRAEHFVLAAGGLENPLLLLNIDRRHNGSFSRRTQAIGKYYMDHLHLYGDIVPISCYVPHLAGWSDLPDYKNGQSESSNDYFVRPFLTPTERNGQKGALPFSLASLGDFHSQCQYVTFLDFRHKLQSEIEANGGLKIESTTFDFGATPTESSYVALSDRTDALGQNKGVLNWKVEESDFLAVYDAMRSVEAELATGAIARLRISEQFRRDFIEGAGGQYVNGRHHMGATRMSRNGETGVVDHNCRVHGMQNLYLAGASVFPSYDWSGPTFTATALSFRLADHLIGL